MTAAHTAVIVAMREALEVNPLTLEFGRLPGAQVGRIHFPTRKITIAQGADVPRFTSAMMHELVHLERGPSFIHDIAADEAAVLEETARRLTQGSLPLLIRRDVATTAAFLGVDPAVVRLAVAMASRQGVA